MNEKWDKRFMELAKHISTWSKDPSSKVGAVIANGKDLISVGYNGFAAGIDDDERLHDRDIKYKMIIHAEVNAILKAKCVLDDYGIGDFTIYTWPFPPCAQCTSKIIQVGISRIVSVEPSDEIYKRWENDFDLSVQMCNSVFVNVEYIEI